MSQDQASPTSDSPPSSEPLLPAIESRFAKALSRSHGDGVNPGVQLREDSVERLASERIDQLRAEGQTHQQRYVLEGELGRGGMGAVLEIFDADLRRKLAMKVALGRGEDAAGDGARLDPAQLLRFLEEAQVTGQLDHPGVVPVHELGVDSEGHVYFTMRLVRGQELASVFEKVHAGDPEWTLTRALGALLKVCEAMSYAHDKGVVHRDLKPANVMVGRHGEVYVMDWGLARVEGREDSHDVRPRTEGELTLSEVYTDRRDAAQRALDSPVLTMDGSVMGTPYYMPPEQAAGRQAEIGPRSDVYALGAMLYHLLAGRMPYHTPGDRPSPYTVLALVMNGPPRPIHELTKEVPPELEAICEKAMAREPGDRYADMGELAEDLRAFLENRVVGAYRTGALIELRKWIQRNRALALTGAALVLLAVGGSGTAAIVLGAKNEDIRRAHDDALLARDHAEEARRASANVTDFLVRQFEALEPESTRGRPVQVDELLGRAALTLDQDLSTSPEEAARLREVLGKAFFSLGRYAQAEPLLERALNDRSELLGDDHPETIGSRGQLALLYRSQGSYAEAERLYVHALERRRALLGEDHPDTLVSMDALAQLFEHQGRFEEAEALQDRVLERRRALLGPKDPATLGSLSHLAHVYQSLGRDDEAEQLFQQVLGARREVLGEDHPDTLTAKDDLAALYQEQERHAEAEPLLLEVLERLRVVLGEDHPSTLTSTDNLAMLYESLGRYEEAEELYALLLEKSRAVLGEDHPDTLTSRSNLALLYESQGRDEEAERLHLEVLERSRAVLGPDHPDTLISLNNLAGHYANLGRDAEAERLYSQLLESSRAKLGRDHRDTLDTLQDLAELYARQGRWADARLLARELLELTPEDAEERAEVEQLLKRLIEERSEE